VIRDYQAIQKTWFIKGHQKKIPTYGKHLGVKLLGVLNYETGYVYCEEHEKYDAEVFLPPYSPNLNLIEGLWGWLKSNVVNNVFYSKVDEIRISVNLLLAFIFSIVMKNQLKYKQNY